MSQIVKEVKASTDSVLKLTIKPANDSDWLQVYLEDFGKTDNGRHAGRLVLVVSGDAYSHYWSHMSTPLIEFIQNASSGYLIMKLTSSELKEQIYATGDEMQNELIKYIFEQRRDDEISKEAARELYDDIHFADWERPTDEHGILEKIYGCDWWECIPKVDNPEYDHLFKVIDLLKQGLAQHAAGQGDSQKLTKYDWSNVPPEVEWINTDSKGVTLWAGDIKRTDLKFYPSTTASEPYWGLTNKFCDSDLYKTVRVHDGQRFGVSPFHGDWSKSLEQRPAQGGAL